MIDKPNVEFDEFGIPLGFPNDLDTSGWPKHIPMAETYDATVAILWAADRPLYDAYLACCDSLIAHCAPSLDGNKPAYWRRRYQ